jgi:hypothetical protein
MSNVTVNTITISHQHEDTTVLTADSTAVNVIKVRPDADMENIQAVTVEWVNGTMWTYLVATTDWYRILTQGVTAGSLGKIANAVKREGSVL